jgi:hypothetical protein
MSLPCEVVNSVESFGAQASIRFCPGLCLPLRISKQPHNSFCCLQHRLRLFRLEFAETVSFAIGPSGLVGGGSIPWSHLITNSDIEIAYPDIKTTMSIVIMYYYKWMSINFFGQVGMYYFGELFTTRQIVTDLP